MDCCCLDAMIRTQVFVDPVGPHEVYEAKLRAIFPTLQFTVVPKADALFPVVSAASIVAKVTRDVMLEVWAFSEAEARAGLGADREFGSGYPSGASAVSAPFLPATRHPPIRLKLTRHNFHGSQTRALLRGSSAIGTPSSATRPSHGTAGAPSASYSRRKVTRPNGQRTSLQTRYARILSARSPGKMQSAPRCSRIWASRACLYCDNNKQTDGHCWSRAR